MLESSKSSVKSSEEAQKDDNIVQCDQCSFRCENEDSLITHMSKDHEECYSCDLCGEYFGTNNSLQDHNKHTHSKKNYINESESDDVTNTDSKEVGQHQDERKKKKKKKNGRN